MSKAILSRNCQWRFEKVLRLASEGSKTATLDKEGQGFDLHKLPMEVRYKIFRFAFEGLDYDEREDITKVFLHDNIFRTELQEIHYERAFVYILQWGYHGHCMMPCRPTCLHCHMERQSFPVRWAKNVSLDLKERWISSPDLGFRIVPNIYHLQRLRLHPVLVSRFYGILVQVIALNAPELYELRMVITFAKVSRNEHDFQIDDALFQKRLKAANECFGVVGSLIDNEHADVEEEWEWVAQEQIVHGTKMQASLLRGFLGDHAQI